MDEAFLSLLEEKDFEYITVKEICEQAGVNRSTFYLHYENMGDLLTEALEYINSRFLTYFDTDGAAVIKKCSEGDIDELIFITPEYLCPYLEFIRDNKRLFLAMLTKPDAYCAMTSFRRLFDILIDPIMERMSLPEEERLYIVYFYINGIMVVVSEWLRRGCDSSVEDICAIIIKCILSQRENVHDN